MIIIHYFEMSKRKKSPAYYTLLIPGIFMAVLGLGNVLLGSFKYEQYQDTLIQNRQELESYPNSSDNVESLSPLQRLRSTTKQSTRIMDLVRKAEARRDLYSLVIYGGKVFLLISALLLGGAVLKKYHEDNRQSSS